MPEWYLDAKFGIFIHWGVYAVPAFDNEWYPRQMYQRARRSSSTTWRRTARSTVRLQGFIPMFKAERFDRGAVGGAVQGARARGLWCRWRSTTTASRCTTANFTDWSAAKMGPEAGHHRRAGRRRSASEGLVLASPVAPRGALVVHQRRHEVRLGRARSDVRGLLRPGAPSREAGRLRPTRRSWTTGWRARARWWTNTSRSSSGSTGGSSSPRSSRICSSSPHTTTTAARNGTRVSPSTTRSTAPSPSGGRVDIERGQLDEIRPHVLADRHSVVEELLGLRRGPGVQDGGVRSSTT